MPEDACLWDIRDMCDLLLGDQDAVRHLASVRQVVVGEDVLPNSRPDTIRSDHQVKRAGGDRVGECEEHTLVGFGDGGELLRELDKTFGNA